MRGRKSLLYHLAAFALVVCLPLLVGLAITTDRFVTAERSRLNGLTKDADRDIATHIELELSTRAATLEALASTSSLQDGNIPIFEHQARELARRTGADFVLYDLAGRQIVNTGIPPGASLPQTTDAEAIGAVTRTKRVDVSNVVAGTAPARFQARIAVPVTRGGDVTAVLSSTISPQQLSRVLKTGLPEGPFFATILDRAGVILARSATPEEFIGKAFPALAAQTERGAGSIALTNPQGVPIVGYYRRSGLSGWVVVAAIERSALTAPLRQSLWGLALMAACLAALAAGGAWWVGRRVTRAHQTLLAAAAAIGKGEVIVPTSTALLEADLVGDALVAASRSIARQAGELQQANQELEARVRSRTNELAGKTALLETTLNAMNQGLIVIDADRRVPVSNSRSRTMLALPDVLMDRNPTIEEVFAIQEQAGEFADMSESAVRLLKSMPIDGRSLFERQRPDGTVLEVQTVPIHDAGAGSFLRIYTDITEQRRHEHALEEARDAAERANRAKDDFLATMGHEMRTPLNAVIGYSEQLLRVSVMAPDVRRSVDRIRSAAAALLCLVDDVLDIGMIEKGILDIRTEPFALDILVEDAAAMVRPSAVDKNLELHVVTDAMARGLFLGDQDRLRQVLLNLLGNAIKFTPSGAIHLSASGRASDDGSRIVRFAVTDTGIGIGQVQQSEVFQRFYQVDPATNRWYGGVGLGLAISKQLVERMGGSIGVESALGRGSTFWFELKLVPVTAANVATRHVPPDAVHARILVADDVVMNQELARELLESAGHVVTIVSNGTAAVAAAVDGAFDLILMDLAMPDMDGLTATRLIRASGGPGRLTPIVACTANVVPTHVTALRDAGADAYLRKPLRPAELLGTVARFASHGEQKADGETITPHAPTEYDGGLDIVSLLGAKRVIAALDGLAEELRTIADANHSDDAARSALAQRAHTLIATASMLGMPELAQDFRHLENTCRRGDGVADALRRLGLSMEVALAKGRGLRNELAASSSLEQPYAAKEDLGFGAS